MSDSTRERPASRKAAQGERRRKSSKPPPARGDMRKKRAPPAVRKKKVVLLMHEDLVPPRDVDSVDDKEFERWKTEYYVWEALDELGHEILEVGVSDELGPLRIAIDEFKPDVVFNLLEEFHGDVLYDQHVASYLELRRVPYTGCNPRGLVLARDKGLSKKILHYHRILAPRFSVFPMERKVRLPAHVRFPLIVKSLIAEGSTGISQSSVVTNESALKERVRFIHESLRTDAIAEEFIDGREVYVGVLGNHRLQVFPTWELFMDKLPEDSIRIATSRVKWDRAYQERHDITIGRARNLPAEIERKIARVSKRVYRRLGLNGYARIDYRLTADGDLYFLEANPNPDISWDAEFASAAEAAGLKYRQLISKIINLGIRRAVVSEARANV